MVHAHSSRNSERRNMPFATFRQQPCWKGVNIAAMLILSRTRLSSRKRRAPTLTALSTQMVNHSPPAMPSAASAISSQPANRERSSSAKNAENGAVSVSKAGARLWSAAAHMGCVPSIGSMRSHSSSSSQLDRLTAWIATWSSGSMADGSNWPMKSADPANSAPVKARTKHTATVAAQFRKNCRLPRRLSSFRCHIKIAFPFCFCEFDKL